MDLIEGFEAAARHLSFTKAAAELFITQSAVSRQIKALEVHLGVKLFVRQHRALALTRQGHELYGAAGEMLQRLQEVMARLGSDAGAHPLAITTTYGFASLWLIPRLRSFTALHPDVDVRISTTDAALNLERGLIDVAVRYCSADSAPRDAVLLFGEELLPVCSPGVLNHPLFPVRSLPDLQHHALLALDDAWLHKTGLDWGTWLTPHGLANLKPKATLRFSTYEQMIQAALAGQGIAMGIRRLVSQFLDSGQLVAPFDATAVGTRGYYLFRSSTSGTRPHVRAFVDWLIAEAGAPASARSEVSSPPPARTSGGAKRRARSRP